MNQYSVEFELFGKKGSCKIKASSPEHAREILKAKLLITKLEPVHNPVDDIMRMFGWG